MTHVAVAGRWRLGDWLWHVVWSTVLVAARAQRESWLSEIVACGHSVVTGVSGGGGEGKGW